MGKQIPPGISRKMFVIKTLNFKLNDIRFAWIIFTWQSFVSSDRPTQAQCWWPWTRTRTFQYTQLNRWECVQLTEGTKLDLFVKGCSHMFHVRILSSLRWGCTAVESLANYHRTSLPSLKTATSTWPAIAGTSAASSGQNNWETQDGWKIPWLDTDTLVCL